MTLKRINREIKDLDKEDLGDMTLEPTDDNMFVWKVCGSRPCRSGAQDVYQE